MNEARYTLYDLQTQQYMDITDFGGDGNLTADPMKARRFTKQAAEQRIERKWRGMSVILLPEEAWNSPQP